MKGFIDSRIDMHLLLRDEELPLEQIINGQIRFLFTQRTYPVSLECIPQQKEPIAVEFDSTIGYRIRINPELKQRLNQHGIIKFPIKSNNQTIYIARDSILPIRSQIETYRL